jgi:hypothetical protein
MKKLLVVLMVGIVGVIVFVPEIREKLLNVTEEAAEDMDIIQDDATAVPAHDKIYTSRKDQRFYHRGDCPKLAELGSAVPRSLDNCRGLYEPCPVCNPPR